MKIIKHFNEIMKIPILHLIFLLLLYASVLIEGFGFDSANSCGPNGKVSRRGRAQMLAQIPCDLTNQAYCEKAGNAYPWHAVRRFVHENQGLMKRMYGDVLHISVLRHEILNNEIDEEDIQQTAAKYSQPGQRRSSKFLLEPEDYTQQKEQPHLSKSLSGTVHNEANIEFTTSTLNEENVEERRSNARTRPSYGSIRNRPYYSQRRRNRTTTTTSTTTKSPNLDNAVLEAIKLLNTDDSNLHTNSVYEVPSTGVDAPQNLSLSTISSSLKMVSTIRPLQHFYAKKRPTIIPQMQSQQQQQQQQIYKISANIVAKEESVTVLKESERTPSSVRPLSSNGTNMLITEEENETLVKGAPETIITTTTTTTNTNKINEQHNNNITTTSITTTTTTKGEHISAAGTTTTTTTEATPSMLPLRVNGELLSNNKQHQETTTTTMAAAPDNFSTPTTPATSPTIASTKPVLRDGQLFQDTLKPEAAPTVNLRGINACPVKEEVVAPFWANNTRGEVLALLNMYPFEQYVHWEKCTHEHKQMYCRDGCRCEQQYRLHRLLAYDPHNECRGIFSDWFRFPSCCICKCYNIPLDFRATSRSPRAEYMSLSEDVEQEDTSAAYRQSMARAEAQVKQAIYEHASEDWYRPIDDYVDDYDAE